MASRGVPATGPATDAAADAAPDPATGPAPDPTATIDDGRGAPDVADATERDRQRVAELLGRTPQGAFEVVVRDTTGDPLVLRNAPLLDDGTPMPTRYWLLGGPIAVAIGRLESRGGVRTAEAAVDPDELAAVHARYAAERDAAIPAGHTGPRPSDGVGGTRKGVKCLHAHYAHHLAGGDDPVGRWVHAQLHDAPSAAPAIPASAQDDDGEERP